MTDDEISDAIELLTEVLHDRIIDLSISCSRNGDGSIVVQIEGYLDFPPDHPSLFDVDLDPAPVDTPPL